MSNRLGKDRAAEATRIRLVDIGCFVRTPALVVVPGRVEQPERLARFLRSAANPPNRPGPYVVPGLQAPAPGCIGGGWRNPAQDAPPPWAS